MSISRRELIVLAMSVLVILRNVDPPKALLWASRWSANRGGRLHIALLHGEGGHETPDLHADDRPAIDDEALSAYRAQLDELFPVDAEPSRKVAFTTLPEKDFGAKANRLLESLKPQLLLLPRPLENEGPVRQLFRAAICETMLVDWGRPSDRQETEGEDASAAIEDLPQKILVPTSTGTNARLALSLGLEIAGADGEVEALYVEPAIGADAERVGRTILAQEIGRAVGPDGGNVRPRIVVSNDPAGAIIETAKNGDYDLVLIGASEGWSLPRLRKNSIPGRVRRTLDEKPVAVARRGIPLSYRFERAIIRFLRASVPQLSRDERIDLVGRIQASSAFNFDFVTLVCLSTLIAGLGLIRNSAAVVIGAMLVAPLMTPLVGCGLALVHGNLVLIRNATRAVLLGFLLSFGIGILLGATIPDVAWTSELISRGEPNQLDLIVALASGLAAAYATARPGLSGALPGVAIAAALVPPIATAGIGMALGHFADALGALLLFLSNIVAIVLGAAFSLYALGMRGERPRERKTLWIRPVITVLVVVVVALTIALATEWHDELDGKRISAELEAEIELILEKEDAELRSLHSTWGEPTDPERRETRTVRLKIRVDTPSPPSPALVEELSKAATKDLGRPTSVQVAASIVVESPTETK